MNYKFVVIDSTDYKDRENPVQLLEEALNNLGAEGYSLAAQSGPLFVMQREEGRDFV